MNKTSQARRQKPVDKDDKNRFLEDVIFQTSGAMDIDENQSFQPDADDSLENNIVTNISANKNYLSMNFFKPKKSSNSNAMSSFNF